jgi:hypothetical protein
MAGKMQVEKSPQEISKIVRVTGTNRLFSRKTVSFSFAEPFNSIPSLLASRPASTLNVIPSLRDENPESPIWCPRQDLNLYDVTH